MKRPVHAMMSALLFIALTGCSHAAEADLSGVTPGKWTMDFEAAQKKAMADKVPILLNFSGSDWCGWCKLMEKNVFTKNDWKTYAKKNVLMVLIDFPKDSSLVPEKFVERNKALQKQFGVQGFPTFIVLDADGETMLGRLSAGRDKTPESFILELKGLTRYCTAQVEAYVKTLKKRDRAAYEKIINQMYTQKTAVKTQKHLITSAEEQIEKLEKSISELEDNAREFRAAQLGSKKLKQYKALVASRAAAKKKLMDWLESSPEQNEENGKQYRAMSEELQVLSSKLAAF